ncbi:hypothetical protein I4U23_017259 [Adineta vaga]|nr:hypothetical protein I4U23_017259 [Adineta vaga]
MSNSTLTTNIRIEHIDSERIWNPESVPKEFFCPICSCLLWKPQYDDKRCSPQIRCQSTPFGCKVVRFYDTLETHQTNECQYLSIRCRYCENLMLINKIVDHEQKCGQQLSVCIECNHRFPLCSMNEHQLSCITNNTQQFQENFIHSNALPFENNGTFQALNQVLFTEEEREIQLNYYNLSWYSRLLVLASVIYQYPFKIPYISLDGYSSSLLFVFETYLSVFFQLSSSLDFFILFHHGFLLIYIGAPFIEGDHYIPLGTLIHLGYIIMCKLLLFFIRFYFQWIPAYVTATFTTGIGLFITSIHRHILSLQVPT